MKKALAISILTLAASACTPHQVAVFKGLNHQQQSAVIRHLQRPAASSGTTRFLACVRAHESATSGGYRAQNPRSSASGAYQFIDSTWRTQSARAGYGGYSRAIHAPPYVQDAVAAYTVQHGGRSHWRGTGC